jgi:hypothetical protein
MGLKNWGRVCIVVGEQTSIPRDRNLSRMDRPFTLHQEAYYERLIRWIAGALEVTQPVIVRHQPAPKRGSCC